MWHGKESKWKWLFNDKEIVKFCNDYIQNRPFSAIDLMEQPVVGYTLITICSSTKRYSTNVYGEAEIKEVDPLNKPGRIDNFSEEMGVTEDGGELYPLSRGPIPEALEHAKAKYAKQLAEEEENQKKKVSKRKRKPYSVSAAI